MTIGKNLEAKVRSDGLDANLTEFLKEEFQQSNKGLQDRQLVIEQELKRLEQEHSKKITADDMHTGFDKTMLSEKKPEHPAYQIKEKPSPTEKQSSNETIVETIHSPDTIKFSPEVISLIRFKI